VDGQRWKDSGVEVTVRTSWYEEIDDLCAGGEGVERFEESVEPAC